MTEARKQSIADSFPNSFEQASLDIEISIPEFTIFENGIFSKDMNEKWHVYALNEVLYLARSWTRFCIYKVFTKQQNDKVLLSHFHVNRDDNQYQSLDIEFDTILLKKLLQMYLNREDFYIDPKLELPLIKVTIKNFDPHNEFKRSIGGNTAGLTRQIYQANNHHPDLTKTGSEELLKNIASIPDDEPLTSLYMYNKATKASTTFYFDKEAGVLLGQITYIEKKS